MTARSLADVNALGVTTGQFKDIRVKQPVIIDHIGFLQALHAAQGPGFGAEVLLLGVPRYAFGLAALALPWLRRGLPDRLSRKMVCVLQMGALIALQLPPLPDRAGEALIAAALAALALSFGRDILWLHRRRP